MTDLKPPYGRPWRIAATVLLLLPPAVACVLALRHRVEQTAPPERTIGLAVLLALVGVFAAGHILMESAARRKLRVTFAGREAIEPIRHYSSETAASVVDAQRFVSAWNLCARLLGVPADLVRPTDRFDREFAPVGFFDAIGHPIESLYDLAMRGHRRDKALHTELMAIHTFGEFVTWLAGRPAAPPTLWQRLVAGLSRRSPWVRTARK